MEIFGVGDLSLLIFVPGETPGTDGHFFLPTACFATRAADFCAAALLDLDCFWLDFFWFAFGDLSPMMFCFLLLRLTRLRAELFPRRHAYHVGWRGACKQGRQFIWRGTNFAGPAAEKLSFAKRGAQEPFWGAR